MSTPLNVHVTQDKLSAGKYASFSEWRADVALTFDNAILYNPAGPYSSSLLLLLAPPVACLLITVILSPPFLGQRMSLSPSISTHSQEMHVCARMRWRFYLSTAVIFPFSSCLPANLSGESALLRGFGVCTRALHILRAVACLPAPTSYSAGVLCNWACVRWRVTHARTYTCPLADTGNPVSEMAIEMKAAAVEEINKEEAKGSGVS